MRIAFAETGAGAGKLDQVQKKTSRKAVLFRAALDELRTLGWKVERIPGNRKSSLRRLTSHTNSALATIRTTQDRHIAFPRDAMDDCWLTLNDADVVVIAATDDTETPSEVWIHLIKAEDMRERFDRAYEARLAAGYKIPVGRGLWLPLYVPEDRAQPNLVGAGAGLEFPPVARVPLPADWNGADGEDGRADGGAAGGAAGGPHGGPHGGADDELRPLTISEAKERLARTLGVKPVDIKITVEA